MTSNQRLVIGCMTGTSCDGLDAALVRIHGHGLGLRAELLAHRDWSLNELGPGLLAYSQGQALSAGEVARLARRLAEYHVTAISALCAGSPTLPDFACVHGQTVFHGGGLTWQLLDSGWLAQTCGLPICYNLRAADLAAGGQGAPITPLADLLCFGDAEESRCIVNLGGFCNLTRLPAGREPSQVSGGDVCACNQILDGLARQLLRQPYDRDGAEAARGTIQPELVATLRRRLDAQAAGGRSLGSGDEIWASLANTGYASNDVLASAATAIAGTITEAVGSVDRVILAGGGVRHAPLRAALASALASCLVDDSDTHGVPIAAREAMAMAVLGALCQDGIPITLSQVTGCPKPPIAGAWVGMRRG